MKLSLAAAAKPISPGRWPRIKSAIANLPIICSCGTIPRVFLERWRHAAGCRRWFNVVRDTVSHQIIEIYAMGSLPKSKAGKNAYQTSWRRDTAAEAAAKPVKNGKEAR